MAPAPLRFLLDRRWQLGLASAALLALWAAVRSWLGPPVPAHAAVRGELVERVVASGQVMPPARVSLGSVQLARVAAVLAEEGDRVKAGQILVRLDDAEPRARVAQARAAAVQATVRLDQVRGTSARVAAEALRQAEARMDQAQDRLRRAEQLAAGGAVASQELDDARKGADVARSQRASAAAQAQAAGASGSEARLAAAALSEAQAALAAAESRLEQHALAAPSDGVVLTRACEPGDVVPAGKPLVVMARSGATRLSVQPDEKNLALLALGQKASAVADAFPDRPFDAEVTFIAPLVDAARGTVEVRLHVGDPPPFLRPDMTVSVNVEVGRRSRALLVAAEAIRESSGELWVMAVRDGRTERRRVHVGVRGQGMVEILGGLEEGEMVVSPRATAITVGRRVRPRPLPREQEMADAL